METAALPFRALGDWYRQGVHFIISARYLSAWALIVRELRAWSRQGQTFWVRVISGAAGIFTLASLLLVEIEVGPYLGYRIFAALNTSMTFIVLLVAPVITADCIAQEKREGTLGLLFLAPLEPSDVVFSKFAINLVRAMSLLLAMLPMLVLPVVFGGIPANMLIFTMLHQVGNLLLALSAGILASSIHREFIQAAVWAIIYTILFYIGSRLLPFLGLHLPLLTFLISIAVSVLVIRHTGRTLKEKWEKEGSDFSPPFWVRLFSDSELWRTLLKWDTRKARGRHPIAWLQEYSWTARLAKWGWCAMALLGEMVVLLIGTGVNQDRGYHMFLGSVVVLGIALTGANSFRTERLTGAIELLLVAPISPPKLIGGRLWGIWVHFFPAVAIIGFLWLGTGPLMRGKPEQAWLLISSYIFLPMIGLYVSMFSWNVLVAWLVIFLGGAVIPFFAVQGLGANRMEEVILVVLIQAVLGGGALFKLHRDLVTRNFGFQHG